MPHYTRCIPTYGRINKGKRLVAFFNGYIYDLPGSMNGHTRMDRLLASPDIDMIAAPISYNTLQERLGGGAGGAMSALDSVALHGKLDRKSTRLNSSHLSNSYAV